MFDFLDIKTNGIMTIKERLSAKMSTDLKIYNMGYQIFHKEVAYSIRNKFFNLIMAFDFKKSF
jgi:hypothetical protein